MQLNLITFEQIILTNNPKQQMNQESYIFNPLIGKL